MALKIYTKTGDLGKTSLIGGTKVSKSHLRIESYGTVDELNSYIGLCRDLITDETEKANRLTELNVQEQVFSLAKTSTIQRAWKHEQRPDLHGWVYGLENGIIKPVFDMKAGTHIDELYEYDDL